MTTDHHIPQLSTVDSKQIAAIGHIPESNTLYIEFTPRAGEVSGSIYKYDNVNADLHAEFMAAQSKGNYFYNHIKNDKEKYPFTKVRAAVPMPADSSEPGREAA